MRAFPQGVTVVTTLAGGVPKGITVSSFTSVSLVPPLVLISLAKGSALHDLFTDAEFFAINFLADDQKSVSDRFAGRTLLKDRFEGLRHREGYTRSPVIEGARAIIECRRWRVDDGGDHSLVLGEVVRADKLSDKPPLVYYAQQYTTSVPSDVAAPPSDIVF